MYATKSAMLGWTMITIAVWVMIIAAFAVTLAPRAGAPAGNSRPASTIPQPCRTESGQPVPRVWDGPREHGPGQRYPRSGRCPVEVP